MRRILILAKDRSLEELVSKIHKELLKLSKLIKKKKIGQRPKQTPP